MPNPIRLYRYALSGHAHRVQLMLSLLQLPCELVDVDLAAEHVTIADVAKYSYAAHAPEGGIALDPWPRIRAWVQRVEALPGFVGMQCSPLPTAA